MGFIILFYFGFLNSAQNKPFGESWRSPLKLAAVNKVPSFWKSIKVVIAELKTVLTV